MDDFFKNLSVHTLSVTKLKSNSISIVYYYGFDVNNYSEQVKDLFFIYNIKLSVIEDILL